jgi:protein-disulfide isomerase
VKRRSLILTGATGAIGLGALGLGVTAWPSREPQTKIPTPPVVEGSAPLVADMILGEGRATPRIIEYASFTCVHCARFHAQVFPQIKRELLDPEAAHFVFREVYFDRPGLWASMLARKAGPERYFGMVDLLYQRQHEWTKGSASDIAKSLGKLAQIGGMTQDEVNSALSDTERAETLMAWYRHNAERDGITATPTLLVGDRNLGTVSYGEISAAVAQASR